ncbi:hypothetical protein GQX73_g7664 [Xylaria multiplex]|uniref:Protein NO VEIN C-terminal domain-containing protein n=1 Tax=Xylaria multiplex TaxID=323545 RepID=A0A7C8MQ21_9PEZI|nr:hypothetical protein GQX73_g7664 [Xylaria multiplex]
MSHNKDAARLSEAEARALVERIADEHGYVSEDVLQTMTPEARRAVERAFHKKDAMIGLSKNLYTSPARFVFEMLQNADDNSFSRARSRNEEPFVKFNVAPRYITVECNEDGFTPKNLSAICSIGKSSKTGAQGRGDSGIGMISPIWEEWENRPATGITRIKLFLIDNLDVGTKTEHPIMQQFRDIQETYLLFMKNIRCVKVNFVDDNESIISAATYSIRSSPSNENRASLVRQENHGSERINNYHVTRHLACGLPRNENREYSDAEQTVQSWSSSEVVLAFPLDDKGCAPEEVTSQQVFAFLPIRNMGFKFLIQADFVTQANRQDIVTSSARNQALRDGIADAFAEAMKQLCTDELLRYTWIRYLPVMNDYPWDEYWTGLFDRIKRKVQATPLMHSITENFPYKIGQMRKSRPSDADSNGDPIFKNISPERYLSRRYLKSELDKIHNHYGLKLMEYSEILMRASEDLNTPNSRMKTIATDDEWHEKAARLLSCAFVENEELRQTIAELDVIPLENGQWARARRAPYQLSFPSTDDGLQIPRDLPLSIINSSASEGPFRSQLYSLLGATRPSAARVRELIFNKYSTITNQNFAFGHSDRPEEISIAHLEFLYHTDGPSPADIKKYQYMAVITEENYLVTPWSTDVYISSDHPYGANKLLRPISSTTPLECESQGFPAHFLLSKYVMPSCEKLGDDGEGEADIRSTSAWFDWLQTRIGIRVHLKLFDGDGFTDIFQYIIDNRREDILGLIQYQWPMIQEYISGRPSIKKHIADIEVPCNGGQDFCSLSRTYLPLPELKARFSQYAKDESDFRFLNFDNTLAPDDLSAWAFLSDHFGVGNSDTLSFYLDLLVTASCDKSASTRKVFDLYQIIYGKVISSDDVENGRGIVKSFFEDNALVMLPTTEGQKWEYGDYCRWDAPKNMRSISGLEAYYSPMYEETPALKSTLAPFMREIVGVQGLSWTDIVYELDRQKADDGNWDGEVIRQMYQLLADLKPDLTDEDQIQVKETFGSRALILAAGSWHTTDACIWSSATYIPGKAALNTDWPSLKMFFVHFLGVPTLTLNMVYKELQRKGASENTSISEMKQELWQFNSLLSVSQERLSAEPILNSRVFPVRSPDGSVALLSAASNDFAVVDRKALGLRFNELAKLLDFTFDEVHRLQPFLAWAGLDERRLSVRVAEVTAPVVSAHLLRESKLQIQPRAYALCRIAAHLRSPKAQNPEAFYQLLLNSTVLETDEIKSELHLPEDDRILKVEQFQAELHIEATEDTLHIYVPRDSVRQDICFLYNLPYALYKWIMDDIDSTVGLRENEQAKRIISSILAANPSSLELLLEKEGIVELDFPEFPEEAVEEYTLSAAEDMHYFSSDIVFTQSSDNHASAYEQEPETPILSEEGDSATLVSEVDTSGAQTPVSSLYSPGLPPDKQAQSNEDSPPRGASEESPSTQSIDHSDPSSETTRSVPASGEANNTPLSPETVRASTSSPEPLLFSQPPTPVPSRPGTPKIRDELDTPKGSAYISLLDTIINAARVASIPEKGTFDMSVMRVKLNEVHSTGNINEDYFKLRTTRAIERDKMIGAAGELYVFEMLSNKKMGLSFPRTRWQSIIRTYVTVHSDYADMGPWTGIETADFVYTDFDSDLTQILIDGGYLDQEVWKGQAPTYYIDVKTTMGGCETPFFMSKSQCKRVSCGHKLLYISYLDIVFLLIMFY